MFSVLMQSLSRSDQWEPHPQYHHQQLQQYPNPKMNNANSFKLIEMFLHPSQSFTSIPISNGKVPLKNIDRPVIMLMSKALTPA